jgi:hypothetical protein
MLTPAQIAHWMAKPSKQLIRTPSTGSIARNARFKAEANARAKAVAQRANLKKRRAAAKWQKAVQSIRTAQRAIRTGRLLPGHGSRTKSGLNNAELRALSAYAMLSNGGIIKRSPSGTYRKFA